jgi:nucleoside-diphosphate-sugar epimerase
MGLQYTIARLFTNYSEDDPSGLVISKWLEAHRNGIPLVLRGEGSQSRDFIHVSDTCKALLAICEQHPVNCSLDIGTGSPIKLIDIVKLFGSNYVEEAELPGYAHFTRANVYDTAKRLKWMATVDLIAWIKNQIR